MAFDPQDHPSFAFLKALGFPEVRLARPHTHFDFRPEGRRILVIGPMGSGKTEFAARIWRDSQVLQSKSARVAAETTTEGADRRHVFFLRSALDEKRFSEYPSDALAYRNGFERLGRQMAYLRDSFQLECLLEDHPEAGTWILDEASFFDERLAYVIRRASQARGLTFVFPTLILNFRREIFNNTARLLLDMSTDVIPLTAYCEHPDCMDHSVYTYRSYRVDDQECPAPYFDPLIIIGGDKVKDDPREPDYCTRCDRHHYLPGKDYTFLTLKPLGEAYARGRPEGLTAELKALRDDLPSSQLAQAFEVYPPDAVERRALRVPCLAEKALMFLYAELNLLREEQFLDLAAELDLDWDYLRGRLTDNGRPLQENSHAPASF